MDRIAYLGCDYPSPLRIVRLMNHLNLPESSNKKKPSKFKTLIVENNPDHCLIIESSLRPFLPQERLIWMNDPSEVLPYLEECVENWQDLPRLIFLNLYMPHREQGLALLQALKTYERYKRIPVVVLSSSDSPTDIVDAYDQGANSFCTKPELPQDWLSLFEGLITYWYNTNNLN